MTSAYTSLNSLFLLPFFIASLSVIAQSTDPIYVGQVCTNRVSKNTTDKSNVGHLLRSLASNSSFFTSGSEFLTEGQKSEKVFGLFLCRGDISLEICRECVTFATIAAWQRCPGGKEFLIQYDECMLGYSDRNIFMDNAATPTIITWNPQTVAPDQSDVGMVNLVGL